MSAEYYAPLKGLRVFVFWHTNKVKSVSSLKSSTLWDRIRFNWTSPQNGTEKPRPQRPHVKECFAPGIIGYWPDASPSIRSNSAPSPSLGGKIDFCQWEVNDHISTALMHHAVYSSLYWPTTQKHRHHPHTTSALDLPHQNSIEYFSLLLIDSAMQSWRRKKRYPLKLQPYSSSLLQYFLLECI